MRWIVPDPRACRVRSRRGGRSFGADRRERHGDHDRPQGARCDLRRDPDRADRQRRRLGRDAVRRLRGRPTHPPRLADDMRLLDDIGWEPEPDREPTCSHRSQRPSPPADRSPPMSSERRDVGPVTVVIPIDAVLAVRSSAQMSRDGISDDYEGYRHKGRDYEDMARRRAGEDGRARRSAWPTSTLSTARTPTRSNSLTRSPPLATRAAISSRSQETRDEPPVAAVVAGQSRATVPAVRPEYGTVAARRPVKAPEGAMPSVRRPW